MSEVRICENCHHHNDINNLECEKCGYDLTFALPIDESTLQDKAESERAEPADTGVVPNNNNLKIVSADKTLTINLYDGLVIGRESEYGDYFDRSNYVSRKHAVFHIKNGETYIFDASTNGTFLNDKKLPKLTEVPVRIGDKVTFADVSFEVQNAD